MKGIQTMMKIKFYFPEIIQCYVLSKLMKNMFMTKWDKKNYPKSHG